MESLKKNNIFYRTQDLPDLRVGDTVAVSMYTDLSSYTLKDMILLSGNSSQKSSPKALLNVPLKKDKIRVYKGTIISKHLNTTQPSSTITVLRVFQGIAIEKVFLVNSPWVKTVKVLSQGKVRGAKINFLRKRTRNIICNIVRTNYIHNILHD